MSTAAMNPERWARVESLCADALERPSAKRLSFLEEACAGDAGLLQEVLSLIEADEGAPLFLESPAVVAAIADRSELAPDVSIGPYHLVRRLGHGGMGEVYLATRDSDGVKQAVALKVIRPGMHTEELLQRFRLERRILAHLHHPHIALLLDAAATEDGRPYFVMEYVDGVPLTQYCDDHRLDVSARLRLFLAICGAVQHAHQHLVVHRDLKPRNILVTADGIPKLLDFGIGKVLEPNDVFGSAVETSTDVRLLTPEYAAPEQVKGDIVTTATDVYALGVMLYELLAGHHPFASAATRAELERAVLNETPARPSATLSRVVEQPIRNGTIKRLTPETVSERRSAEPRQLRRRLSGDLDNIVLMAMRKEPDRRYPSAAALADDIRRHLGGLPVVARPDTVRYRMRKFVGRNATGVAVGVTTLLALVATTTVTLVQSRRVSMEAERVARERDKAVEVRGFLLELFGASGADQAAGDTVTARRLLDLQAAQLATAYSDRPDLKAEMMEVLADGYQRLGLFSTAEPLASQAVALQRQLHGDRSLFVASPLSLHGWILHELGRSRDAEPLLRGAIERRREAGDRARVDLARSLNDLGVVYNALTRYAEAESVLTEALSIRRSLLGDRHRAVGVTANNLAAAHYYQRDLDQAVMVQQLALSSLAASVGPDHPRSILALSNLAAFKVTKGDRAAAEADFRELLSWQQRLRGADHPMTMRVQRSLGSVVLDRAIATGDRTVLVEATALLREALASFERALGSEHPEVGMTLHRMALAEAQAGSLHQAVAMAERAARMLKAAYGDKHQATISAQARLDSLRKVRG